MGEAPRPETTRLVSLDAYRGFIMLAMVSGGFAFHQVAKEMGRLEPGVTHPILNFLGSQFDHRDWEGCAFWDLIQPSFMFMVGVAMPYSHASRVAKGASTLKIAGHTLYRALLLVFLGVFLSSNWDKHTNFTFVNVLSQIGLGYAFVSLLIGRGFKVQLAVLAVILAGYWYYFYAYAIPGPDFNFARVGVDPAKPLDWPWVSLFAHWNKNTNAAAAFDEWFLNLFPPHQFAYNRGGYQTLNFVPSMGTMILGLMAGELLRKDELSMRAKFVWLCVAAAVCLAVGYVMGETVCPLVKRIWTPSWALYSSGWTFAMLAAFYAVIDWAGWKRWSWPLVVVGMNSIAVYMMSQLLKPWILDTIKRHFGQEVFQGSYVFAWTYEFKLFDPVYAPVAQWTAVVLVIWLAAIWMYRQRIFVRI